MGLGGQRYVPVALSPGKRPDITVYGAGWASEPVMKKKKISCANRGSNPEPSSA
jgi:hypothetical protein